jgi:phosphate transport system ATP-binding protein
MSIDPFDSFEAEVSAPAHPAETILGTFSDAWVVQLVSGEPDAPDALVADLVPATVMVSDRRIVARDDESNNWVWLARDLQAVVHADGATWTILDVPGITDFGVSLPVESVREFRRAVDAMPGVSVRSQRRPEPPLTDLFAPPAATAVTEQLPTIDIVPLDSSEPTSLEDLFARPSAAIPATVLATEAVTSIGEPASKGGRRLRFGGKVAHSVDEVVSWPGGLAGIDARDISAWFGTHQVLDRVSLEMIPGKVTALIGPSGCGKSTFLRILNRMHEMIPAASMGGQVIVDGHDLYDTTRKLTDARREVGMVFQKPNPFPAMSIYDNVVASLQLTGVKATASVKDELVESCLMKAGLWNEVKDRLRQPGGGLSGGQQQRLCIARALAIRPRVLLMDEPCSALDPTSTRRIEETILQIVSEVTIVIVTHNMQQAQRVSDNCAFFLAEQGTPGVIVEHGPTDVMFSVPQDPRTSDYVQGRFG